MDTAARLVLPSLSRSRLDVLDEAAGGGRVAVHTDEGLFATTGVRVAFTERAGGVSKPPFNELNLASHVNDDAIAVQRNRRILMGALGFPTAQLIVPNQVHGTHVVVVGRGRGALDEVEAARSEARSGADAIVVDRPQTAALLCFADCVPLIFVAPGGVFAVAHAGWRGVYAHIAVKVLYELCAAASCGPSECNAYIGPYIHAECFEVGADLQRKFALAFGAACAPAERHVDLGAALRHDLSAAGVPARRVADVGICTACATDRFYSYRAQAGVCGRHGAFAVREG